MFSPKSNNSAKYLYIQSKNYLFEFTNQNVRLKTGFNLKDYSFVSQVDISVSTFPAMDDVSKIHFTNGNKYLFIFAEDKETIRIDMDKIFTDLINAVSSMRDAVKPYTPSQWTPGLSSSFTYTPSGTAPTGYDVDYAVTFVYESVETFVVSFNQTLKKPAGTGQFNTINCTMTRPLPASTPNPDEMRVYQRPRNGGTYFYVGNAFPVEIPGSTIFSSVS